ncbi:MinD superfamily P-loop ATPase containing an inserted ferredoxin domain [hydrothermal vent metagenome]|uniref:MinD superfamily P-loop ATPase containing an inserted ferredoxin domain n=1 Tax=hydrothermal vent metagenome TaxID=652676 RepID=A0A3B0VDT9_9ZZZZ
MKEIVVLSGKGGTGKTSLTAAFAALAHDFVLCDADVDAADLHLLTAPEIKQRADFKGGSIASINQDKCVSCGRCLELCRFGAVNDDFTIDQIACEGCGVCVDLCPEQAIDFPEQVCGQWFISDTRFGPMVHARLGIAEENSGKLVSLIRKKAAEIAQKNNLGLILTDGPPGVGCPVIASIGGAAVIVIVTEPTVSGLHDLRRLVKLAEHFRIPVLLMVNKFDLNLEQTAVIEEYAVARGITILGRIPFAPDFTRAMIQGQNILEYAPESKLVHMLHGIWTRINQFITEQKKELELR